MRLPTTFSHSDRCRFTGWGSFGAHHVLKPSFKIPLEFDTILPSIDKDLLAQDWLAIQQPLSNQSVSLLKVRKFFQGAHFISCEVFHQSLFLSEISHVMRIAFNTYIAGQFSANTKINQVRRLVKSRWWNTVNRSRTVQTNNTDGDCQTGFLNCRNSQRGV